MEFGGQLGFESTISWAISTVRCWKLIGDVKNFQDTPIQKVWDNDGDQILAYMRKDLVFVFNFSPTKSFTDYGFLVPKGEYESY